MWGKPLSELDITRREFNEACAYLQLNPPEENANRRTASLMAQIANFAGKSLKEGKTVSADDYLGKPKAPRRAQTAEEQQAFLKALAPSKG